jgi:hypothetical protein
MIPEAILKQVHEILDRNLGEEEARRDYPETIAWFRENIPLTELMASYGVKFKPLCTERPDILIGVCPDCGGKVAVR